MRTLRISITFRILGIYTKQSIGDIYMNCIKIRENVSERFMLYNQNLKNEYIKNDLLCKNLTELKCFSEHTPKPSNEWFTEAELEEARSIINDTHGIGAMYHDIINYAGVILKIRNK
jgi:hypothetical protein